MKIAVPYPFLKTGQTRIKESLNLWDKKKDIVICCPVEMYDSFFEDFHYVILPRNSTDIGTKVPKCYISDMIQETMRLFPNEDWYGFGNSDCVPVGNILEGSDDYNVLVYHRTNILEWDDRFEPEISNPIKEKVLKLRQKMSDKMVARTLNREEVPVPNDEQEWTYLLVKEFCQDQGSVYIHGQDLYVFRKNVVQDILKQYLIPKDPILGTGAFDPRLTYWCMSNQKSARVINKLFHKIHDSEWHPDDVEFQHNGGMLSEADWPSFYEDEFLLDLANHGYRGSMDGWFMNAIKKHNRPLWDKIVGE